MRAFLLFVTLILSARAVEVPRENDHFVVTVAWGGGAVPRAKHLVPMSLGFPDETGLVAQCYITVDWWTLFGEPVENYIVEWKRSDHFRTKDSSGSSVTVTAADVEKYPDLKLRFESLVPKAMDFAVEYSLDYMGGLAGADKETLNQRFARQREATNMATRYASDRIVKNDQFLFARSGATPLSVPGSHSWSDFVPAEIVGRPMRPGRYVSEPERQIIAETLKRIRSINFMGIQVIRFEPPEGEMRAIADKLRAYREGKEKPTPAEEVKAALADEVPPYAAKDEWAEAAGPPVPPVPPKLRKDPDGLYYYYNSEGQKAFPKGFYYAEGFCAGPYQVARVLTSSGVKSCENFIDLWGNPVLPFDSDYSSPKHWGSGLFTLRDPKRPKVINNCGLYDAMKKVFILPMEFYEVVGEEGIDKEHMLFNCRKVLSLGSRYVEKESGGVGSMIRTHYMRHVTTELSKLRWDQTSRALQIISSETKAEGLEGEFEGPLN